MDEEEDKAKLFAWEQEFIDTVEDDRKSAVLDRAIRGGGAFRRFKDEIEELGFEKRWFSYRHQAYNRLAEEWCNNSNIQFEYRKAAGSHGKAAFRNHS